MLELLPIVGQELIDWPTRYVIWTILMMAVFSVMYRENPIYAVVEHAMIGTMAGSGMLTGIENTYRLVITPILTGTNVPMVIIVIAGICYFSVFGGRRLANFYRTVISMRLGAMLGITVGTSITVTIYAAIKLSQTASSDPFIFIAVFIGVLTIFYFTFSKWLDTHFALPRRLGYWVVFTYYAGFGVTMWAGRLEIWSWWIYRMAQWPAIVVPIVALAIMLTDAMIRKSRGKREAPTVPGAQSATRT